MSAKGLKETIKKYEERCPFKVKSDRGTIASTPEKDGATILQEGTSRVCKSKARSSDMSSRLKIKD